MRAFDAMTEAYDRWYDTPEGKAIFQAELKCLRSLHEKWPGRWLEVGVGTGRFACPLGIVEGIDPSRRMLDVATGRGITTHVGMAENLPFPERCFDGVLMALTLCFVANAALAIQECRRILRPGGALLLGVVPADSPWGREYLDKASKGHPVYALAHFRTPAEIVRLAEDTRFALADAASTLFWKPGAEPPTEARIEMGIVAEAGFVSLLFKAAANGVVAGDNLEAQR